MAFFRSSFTSVGEALKTVSLAIGLFITSVSGVGYLYTVISQQHAMATQIMSIEQDLVGVKQFQVDGRTYRYRVEQTEESLRAMNRKLDTLGEDVTNIRILVEGLHRAREGASR